MIGDNADLVIASAGRDPVEDKEVPRSLKDETSQDASTPDRLASKKHADALTIPPKDVRHGSRKPNHASKRLRDMCRASSLEALKIQLSLLDTYCGACTLTGARCRNLIPVKNRDAIETSLLLLRTMTQSSEELDATLVDLVRLVHCHKHDCGPASEARAESWIETFPKGKSNQQSPTMLARKVKKALGAPSPLCVGRNKYGMPCKKGIGGQQVENCRRSIEELAKADDLSGRPVWELLLSVLEANRYCWWHVSQQSMQNVQRRLTDLSLLHEAAQRINPAPSTKSLSVFVNPTHATLKVARTRSGLQPKIDAMLKDRGPLCVTGAPTSLLWPSDALIGFWPHELDTTPLSINSRTYIEPYKRTLCEIAAAPLCKDDRKTGYVYAIVVEGSPEMVKIGYTTRSTDTRHEEWIYDCNRKTTLLFPLDTDASQEVPNARRIEALCHAELDGNRRRVYCRGCLKQHIEWFEVDSDEAIATIRKWTLWMKTKPYRTGPRNVEKLGREWQHMLDDQEIFLNEVSTIIGPHTKD